MSGDRHDMTDAEWKILRSVLPGSIRARSGCMTGG